MAGRLSGHFLGRAVGDVARLVCAGLVAAPGALLLATAAHPAVALGFPPYEIVTVVA